MKVAPSLSAGPAGATVGGPVVITAVVRNHGVDELNAAVFVATRGDRFSDADTTIATGVAQLRSQLKRRDIPCVTVEFNTDFVQGLPAARARLYRELEEFFNLHLYNYDVTIGPTRVVR